MTEYIVRRLLYTFVTFWILTVVVFTIIQLPPGDFLTSYVAALEAQGGVVNRADIEALRQQYGLDAGPVEQYFRWLGRFLQGDMGRSFEWNRPVVDLLRERLPYTIMLSLMTLLITYLIAIPLGIYTATHQYSIGDYLFTFIGFAGLATPNFLLALVLMFLFFKYFGVSVGGLFSQEYALAPWSMPRYGI
jgi:peptide/nickel transport system permease protein